MERMDKTCSHKDCLKTRIKARGLCGTHYDRWYVEQQTGVAVAGRETHAAKHVCAADGCDLPGYSVVEVGALCKKHAARWRRNGKLDLLSKEEVSIRNARGAVDKGSCAVEDCLTVARSRGGLCEKHYHRQRKGVDLHTDRAPAPELTLDFIRANTEPGDEKTYSRDCWLWTGRLTKDGYGYEYDPERYRQRRDGQSNKTNTTVLIHRHVFAMTHPEVSLDDVTLDHRCHDPARCSEGVRCPHRRCCNPNHLFVEDRKTNAKRKSSFQRVVISPDLTPDEQASRVRHQLFFDCGHLRVDENYHGRARRCRACHETKET